MRALFHFEKPQPEPVSHPLPSDLPELPGAEVGSAYYGSRMAGDFYDFVRVGSNRTLFGLFDVAGGLKETRAVVSAAQQTFRTAGAALLARQDTNGTDAMMELCLQLNQSILKAAEGVRACPAFAGCYDEDLGLVCYFNAGHTPGLLRDRAGVSELPATGLPLGLFSHMLPEASIVVLEPGAVLLLTSRGVVEGKCKAQEFGLQRTKEVLQQSKATNAKELCASVLGQVEQFMCAPLTHDDATVLALARNS
jgi:serine phosphatase RsbU (regulator of sigma subunit)